MTTTLSTKQKVEARRQRTAFLYTPIVIDKFMPRRGPYRNRVSNKGKEDTLRHYSMLELYEGKLSRTVLRRGSGGNSDSLSRRMLGGGATLLGLVGLVGGATL
jgi:hypothetical protein